MAAACAIRLGSVECTLSEGTEGIQMAAGMHPPRIRIAFAAVCPAAERSKLEPPITEAPGTSRAHAIQAV